jgi:hypothetical protein
VLKEGQAAGLRVFLRWSVAVYGAARRDNFNAAGGEFDPAFQQFLRQYYPRELQQGCATYAVARDDREVPPNGEIE